MNLGPLLSSSIVDDRLVLAAGGSWTAAHARELELLIDGLGGDASNAASVSLDMRGVHALDTFGAWLVERLIRDWRIRGRVAQIIGLAEPYRGLLQDVQRTNRESPETAAKESQLLSALERIGRRVVGLGRDLVPFLLMLGALGAAGFGLAKELKAKVTVVTATERWSAMVTGEPAARAAANAAGIACATEHVNDFPAEGIVETASAKGCDLIVMASHGRRGLSKFLRGRQALRVLALAQVPVLVCR